MNQRIWAAIAIAAATTFGAGVALAQTASVTLSTSDPSPNALPAAVPSSDPMLRPSAAPAENASAPLPTAPSSPAAATASAAAPGGPLVAYVRHTKPPLLIDQTVAAVVPGALFGPIVAATVGPTLAISAGSDIVTKNGIEDPSGDMAHDIALAYAAAHGGRVADGSIADDHKWTRAKPGALAERADGAQYVIDVDPPGMTLIYFPLDWEHRDLMFLSDVRVIDASTGKIVAQAHCFIKTDDSYDMTHGELLADHAAELKGLIVRKGQACVAKMEDKLHLPTMTAQESHAQPGQTASSDSEMVYRR